MIIWIVHSTFIWELIGHTRIITSWKSNGTNATHLCVRFPEMKQSIYSTLHLCVAVQQNRHKRSAAFSLKLSICNLQYTNLVQVVLTPNLCKSKLFSLWLWLRIFFAWNRQIAILKMLFRWGIICEQKPINNLSFLIVLKCFCRNTKKAKLPRRNSSKI